MSTYEFALWIIYAAGAGAFLTCVAWFLSSMERDRELNTHIGEQYLGHGKWAPLFDDDDLEELLDND